MLPNKVYCGDCVWLLPRIKDSSIDMVLTSPPYAEQRKKSYNSIPEIKYPEWLVSILGEIRPKMVIGGNVLINIRTHVNDGQTSDYVLRTRLAIRGDGWREPEELIWSKPNGPPLGHVNRPRRTWEHLLWYSLSKDPYLNLKACGRESERVGFGERAYKPDSRYHQAPRTKANKDTARVTDLLTHCVGTTSKNHSHHPASYPLELCIDLIKTFSPNGGLVLDPFAGSGTTGVAAKLTGRNSIQFELEPEYAEIAARRYEEEVVNV